MVSVSIYYTAFRVDYFQRFANICRPKEPTGHNAVMDEATSSRCQPQPKDVFLFQLRRIPLFCSFFYYICYFTTKIHSRKYETYSWTGICWWRNKHSLMPTSRFCFPSRQKITGRWSRGSLSISIAQFINSFKKHSCSPCWQSQLKK